MVATQFVVLAENNYNTFSYTKWVIIPDRYLGHIEDFHMLGVTNQIHGWIDHSHWSICPLSMFIIIYYKKMKLFQEMSKFAIKILSTFSYSIKFKKTVKSLKWHSQSTKDKFKDKFSMYYLNWDEYDSPLRQSYNFH